MQHWLAIAGCTFGIIGTAALSFDLLRTKSSEESLKQFRKLQDEVDNASQELTIRLNEGLATLANFLSGYLSLMELQAQIEDPANAPPKGADPDLDGIRDFISSNSKVSLRHYSVGKFVEAQSKLASPADVQQGLQLVTECKNRLEEQFKREMASAQRLRTVAIAGVWLVGVGAVAQLLDLLLVS